MAESNLRTRFPVLWIAENGDGEGIENLLNVVGFEFVHDEEEGDHADGDEDADGRAPARRLTVQVRLFGVVGGRETPRSQRVENRGAAEAHVAKREHEDRDDEVAL